MKKFFYKWKTAFLRINLADRFLLLFLFILLLYTLLHLLLGTSESQEPNTIDIIIRTSLASVFGYFISVAFSKPVPEVPKESEIPAPLMGSDDVENKTAAVQNTHRNIQIYIVSGIGLFSLFILIIARHFQIFTPEFTATISQLRDFTASCIGFLISCGNSKTN